MDKRSHVSRLMVLLILLLLFVFVGLAGYMTLSLLEQTESRFGKPGSEMGIAERLRYAFDLYRYEDDLLTPNTLMQEEFLFEIGSGEGVPSIVSRLESAGLIPNAEAMQTYLVYAGLDISLQAGQYRIPTGMNSLQISELFQDATPATISFGVWPGWRMEEVAEAVAVSGLEITAQEFLRAASRPSVQSGYSWAGANSAEGYFLPGTYEIDRNADVDDLMEVLLAAFDTQVSDEVRAGFTSQGLTLHEAVTLASIVEREAVLPEEQGLIASVFLNRLAVGMPLESDPTTQYAIGYVESEQSWWKNPLSAADLDVNSAYNTYVVGGLPPAPICNPSLGALKSVAFPQSSPYYFFRARCDNSGYHNFSITFEEHLQYACP